MKALLVALSVICVVIRDIFTYIDPGIAGLSLLFKGLASGFFVLVGLYCFIKVPNRSEKFNRYGGLMLAGLILSLLADIYIEVIFFAGFGLFFVMQIVYFIAFFAFGKPTKRTVIIFAAIAVPTVLFEIFAPIFDFQGALLAVLGYILVIVLMEAKAFDALKYKNPCAKLLIVGATLFTISDFVLQFGIFLADMTPEISKGVAIANSVLYYGAQLIIALSLSADIFKEEKR